jgi:hypothetical protein
LEGLDAAPLLDLKLDSAAWVPPGQAVAGKDQWQLLAPPAAAPASSARPVHARLQQAEAPGETLRHNTAARQQQRRLSTDSLVLPQSAAQQLGLLAALGGQGQQAPPSATALPKQLHFGAGEASPARQPAREAPTLPPCAPSAAAAAAASITPRRLPKLTDFAQQRYAASSPARPTHLAQHAQQQQQAACLPAAAPRSGSQQQQRHQQAAQRAQQAPPAAEPAPGGGAAFDPGELAAALPHAPPEVAALGARLCADLADTRRGLVLPVWVLRPEDELHPGYVVTLCRRERSGLPLVQELLLLRVQRRAGSSPKKHRCACGGVGVCVEVWVCEGGGVECMFIPPAAPNQRCPTYLSTRSCRAAAATRSPPWFWARGWGPTWSAASRCASRPRS